MAEHWQKTIIEYLSPGYLVPEEHEDMLQNGYFTKSINELKARDISKIEGFAPLPGHPGIEFVVGGHHDATLREAGSDRCIGGYVWVLPWLDPDFRGRGIMSALHKEADDAGHRFTTQNYTISGMMARAKTHLLHVSAALEEGKAVPEEVLADYVSENGLLRLREPMTRERYYAEKIQSRDEIEDRANARALKNVTSDELVPSM